MIFRLRFAACQRARIEVPQVVESGPGRELVHGVGARVAALWRGIGIGGPLAAGARGRDSGTPHHAERVAVDDLLGGIGHDDLAGAGPELLKVAGDLLDNPVTDRDDAR
jgi:hypothetical protein